jgi:hypothetical protein
MSAVGYSLDVLINHTRQLRQIHKNDLQAGDRLLVKTCNSVYSILISQDGGCVVTGGWFDRKGLSPMKTRIAGCTWGGSAIKIDIVAACGLCLEFGNRLVTTSVQQIFVFHACRQN